MGDRGREGKWSLGLIPFGLKSLGLMTLVTWLKNFKPSVFILKSFGLMTLVTWLKTFESTQGSLIKSLFFR